MPSSLSIYRDMLDFFSRLRFLMLWKKKFQKQSSFTINKFKDLGIKLNYLPIIWKNSRILENFLKETTRKRNSKK